MANRVTTISKSQRLFRRVFWIVLDGVGAGALPDAADYNDLGANTLGHVAEEFFRHTGSTLRLPHLAKLGLGNITPMNGTPPFQPGGGWGAFGKAHGKSKGKDTTSGHWEMAGLVLDQPFATYPQGFPTTALEKWVQENELPGVLGNQAASGTTILEQLGEEHIQSGKPILYTSADSVWQVAAHEEYFGLQKLYTICESARKICDSLQVGRVIARPFVGNPKQGKPFQRTYNRKDYAQVPPSKTYLDLLCQAKVPTLGIGKISNIYAAQGIQKNLDSHGNPEGIQILLEQAKKFEEGLVFCNLIDFDMLYGHRRDVIGFGRALEEFDRNLGQLHADLKSQDLMIITADHGNDPTFPGTDHTREYIPILAFSPAFAAQGPMDLGIRETFADIGATVFHALTGNSQPMQSLAGKSFLSSIELAAS
jgi:phosphopentomutase